MPKELDEIDPNYLALLQIEATIKSTFATRGLLKVLLYEGAGLLIGSLLMAFGILNDSGATLGLGAFVVVAGAVAAVVAGFNELGNSKVSSMSISGIRVPTATTVQRGGPAA